MRNTMKVAKWEIKRNLKNKSFVIGLFLTPILMVVFGFLGNLMGGDTPDNETAKIYVHDELNTFANLEATVEQYKLPFELEKTNIQEADVEKKLKDAENTAYFFIDNRAFNEGTLPFYTSEDFPESLSSQVQIFTEAVKLVQMQNLGLTEEQLAAVSTPITIQALSVDQLGENSEKEQAMDQEQLMQRIVPGVFAGVILLSIIFTGMMIFQSASQEKKDKIAEIILSSVTPGELMQGKIVGYFVLGFVQVAVFIAFGIPFILWAMNDLPLFEYLFVPELLLFLLIAVLGYLLFAAIFVGIGATMSDISTAGNFQGLVIMIPFVSFFFIGPVASDPTSILAQVLSYVPFTSPVILLFRLVMLDQWSWVEISVSLAILIMSVWLFMKLAGKIFKVGILLYGKNATPGEIWKWMRA